MHHTAFSQRERNRIETWNAIHQAASTMVISDGPGAATIEAIAAHAGISRRTFFNYFASKEDAVLGTQAPEVTDHAVEQFRNGDEDELSRVVHLFVAVLRTSLPVHTAPRRREVVRAHPHLRQRIHQLLAEVEKLVTDVIRVRMDEGKDVALGSPTSDEGHLEALLMLAGVITKYAFARYHESTEEDVTVFLPEAIAVFRKVVASTR
ncbi:MAG TPA: TetR/AcrR family transcriptional regulator [Beutenbergiaceae bacterium]|nr:TetR/AcrR family transcriptional regulator [Beutenbergiaceae bacterium]